MSDLAADLDLIRNAAEAAGRLALAERDSGLKVWSKSGGSPVTSADMLKKVAAVIDHPRPFIRSDDYFGPDRRRRDDPAYAGPERRKDRHG